MPTNLTRPGVWLPVVALAAVAGVLTQVQPWPEGRVVMALRGFGSRGVTVSDLVVAAVVVVVAGAWLARAGRA